LAEIDGSGRHREMHPAARQGRIALPTTPGSHIRPDRAGASRPPGYGPDDPVDGDQRDLATLMSVGDGDAAASLATPDGTSRAAVERPGRIRSVPWPLAAILIAQAALSLRLVWSNTANTNEAQYLWAGHLEWAHWLHGTTLPLLPKFFSGAPVIYPPLGALADSIGGLAGARILSLCFMLGATTLLWSTTSRLYGRDAAFFASALWAFLGPTLMLGAYATHDAMSLFLVALATWCATAHRTRDEATGWMVTAAAALALANAAQYASTIFDPIVVLLAVLTAWPRPGGKAALRRGALLITCTFGILYLALRLTGADYKTGINQTILMRASGTDSVSTVLGHAGVWVGAVAALACASVVLSAIRRQETNCTLLLAVLAGGALLAPLEQARIHTLTSLDKHADFGAWFAAIAAGYAIDQAAVKLRPVALRAAATAAAGGAIAAVAIAGFAQAQALMASWPNATGFINALRPIVARTHGRLLIEASALGEYYLPAGSQWNRWSNTYGIQLMSGATTGHLPGGVNTAGDPAVYAKFISRGYFSIIVLNSDETPALDNDIESDIARNPGYHIIGRSSYGGSVDLIWAYKDTR
jgi:Dolichyl-phosphate-mannose-protein mannosyltransferase